MYIGVVVQNNDPDNRGRAKVFVPHVNAGVYEKWYGVKKNKSFRFAGKNVDSDLSDIMSDLKTILPWATQASPLGGQSSTGRYHAYTDTGSVSDTNTLNNFTPTSGHTPTEHSLNNEGIGEKPARKYEIEYTQLNDAFTDAKQGSPDGVKRPNKYSYSYKPNSYSNCAKGVFGVPNVGAHVWCFFEDGDPQHPVFFAAAFGQQDWHSVFGNADHDGVDYPGAYENAAAGDQESQNINVETYRNKFLINQKGGTLEFVNTDNREILKMTHYSGSFKEFNNHTTTELAAKNDQKLVLQDQYLTVQGYGGVHYGRDLDYIVQGDHFLRVGKQDDALHRAWREKAREMHHIKQLFETQRADQNAADGSTCLAGAFVSPYQALSGSNTAPCPVCKSSSTRADKYWSLNETFIDVANENKADGYDQRFFSVPIRKNTHTGVNDGDTIQFTYVAPSEWTGNDANDVFGRGSACPACGGDGVIQGSMDGTYDPEPRKQADTWLNEARRIIDQLADIEASLGRGGNNITNVAKHKIETIGMVMNDFGSVRIDTQGKYFKNELKILNGGVVNSRKTSPVIEYVHVDDLPGGSYTLNVCNRWNVQVGAGGVSMKSYGPVDIGGTITNIGGTQVNIGSENEVNIDGGKRLNIVSDILTLRQRNNGQVLVDSNLGVTQNVIIGGGLHVEGELTVQHVTAPCEIQETEQMELWGRTEWRTDKDYWKVIGYEWGSGSKVWDPAQQIYIWSAPKPVVSRLCKADDVGAMSWDGHPTWGTATTGDKWDADYLPDEDCIRMYPHSHHFKNLPLDLKNENKGVREVAKECEKTERAQAAGRDYTVAENKSD